MAQSHYNKRLIVPEELDCLKAELRGAYAYSLTTSTSVTAARYGPLTVLSAMEAMSSDSDAPEATSSSDSDSEDEEQTVPVQLSAGATPLLYSPKEFYEQMVVVSKLICSMLNICLGASACLE